MGLCLMRALYRTASDKVQAFVAEARRDEKRSLCAWCQRMAFLEMKRQFASVRELRLLIQCSKPLITVTWLLRRISIGLEAPQC